jgi:hypothetical protein
LLAGASHAKSIVLVVEVTFKGAVGVLGLSAATNLNTGENGLSPTLLTALILN